MVNINSEVIVERIQKDGVNTIIIAAVIAILSWIFNMYHKSANKYRDQKDQQFREARATFESALKQINKDDTDFNEFYDLLKYTKTTDEYYQLDQLINDKNKEEIKKYIKDKLFEINDKIPNPINEPNLTYKFITRKLREFRIYENIIAPAVYTFFTIYMIFFAVAIIININNDVKKYFLLFNFSASFAIIIFYGSLLLDDDMTYLSTVFIKILYILEFISVLSLEYDVKKGNWFIFLVNLLFVVTIIVTRSKNNVKNITSILNKKRKFRGYNKIISFVKSQNGELLSDEKLVSFIYFFNHKIYGIYQFKKIENNKLVLVKEIRKSYYDSIIDQKRSFQKLKKTPNAKLFNKIDITLNLIAKPEKANRTQMDAIGFFILFYFFLPQLQNIQQEYPASSIVSHNCHQIVQRGYHRA